MFSGFQQSQINNDVQIDNSNVRNCSSNRLKRLNDATIHHDASKHRSKKSRHGVREVTRTGVERAASPDRQSTCYTSCGTALPSVDYDRQTQPRVFHRPFETSLPVAHGDAQPDTTAADKQLSAAVGGRQTDVVSWSDCLRQLATALRRRDDGHDQVLTSVDVPTLDQTTNATQSPPPDCKHRDVHRDVQRDQLRSPNDEDYRRNITTISNNNNNEKKSETSTTVDTGSANDLHRSAICSAAEVSSPLCRDTTKTWRSSNADGSKSPPVNSPRDRRQQRQGFFLVWVSNVFRLTTVTARPVRAFSHRSQIRQGLQQNSCKMPDMQTRRSRV